MDCSVRFVCETRMNSSGKHEQLGGLKPALCLRGDKVALAVINDELWVRTIEMDLPSHDKSSYVTYHGAPYEPKPFADRLLMSAKLAGKPMTRRAKHILTLLDKTVERELPQEVLEKEVLEQERVYAENTPKERQKAAERPSKVRDVTTEYADKLYTPVTEFKSKLAELNAATDARLRTVVASVSTGIRKVPKKIARVEAPPEPKKPATAAKGPISAGLRKGGAAKPAAERGTLIKRLASEFKKTTFELRVMIRATGMRAPYEDEKKVRDAVKRGMKLVANQPKKAAKK
jgi:hypothetical protein